MIAGLLMSAMLTDPYQVFGAARARWESQHYPEKIAYTVAVDVVESGVRKSERYEAGYDAAEDTLLVDPVSDREKAHPYYAPGGFGFNVALFGQGRPNPDVDFFGVPFLAPNYSFGIGVTPRGSSSPPPDPMELVREIRAEFHDPLPPSRNMPVPAASPGLREIAVVSTRTETYDITLAGIEPVDETPAYHLVLHPLREPGRYRLRDLWIDTQSFAPRKLVEAQQFRRRPGHLGTVERDVRTGRRRIVHRERNRAGPGEVRAPSLFGSVDRLRERAGGRPIFVRRVIVRSG